VHDDGGGFCLEGEDGGGGVFGGAAVDGPVGPDGHVGKRFK